MKRDEVILVRGGGDLATGTIHRLWSAGLKVLVLEAEQPAAIRRQVSVSEAVYEGEAVVEGMRATLVQTLDEAVVVWCRGDVPVIVDPKGALIPHPRRCAGDGGPEGSADPAGAARRCRGRHPCEEKSRHDAGYGPADHRPRPGLHCGGGC